MKLARTQSLVVRIYGFAAVCVLIVAFTQWKLSPWLTGRPWHGKAVAAYGAFAKLLADTDDSPAAISAVATAIATSASVDVTIIAVDGAVLGHGESIEPDAPIVPLSAANKAQLAKTGVAEVLEGETAARIDGRGRLAGATIITQWNAPGFPWGAAAVMLGLQLLILMLLSVPFARSLVRPLRLLANAAGRFGSGDLKARVGMSRRDEFGLVGSTFDHMAVRVTKVLESNRSLVAAVSHELRTPMARIRVALELAVEDPEAAQELLIGVSGDLTELERLVEDILTMTRLDTAGGTTPLRVESVAAADLVARASERFAQRHIKRELVVDIDPVLRLPANDDADSPDSLVIGDPVLLRRVLDNLLENAAKYTPAETSVTLAAVRTPGGIDFIVRDHGPGLTPDELTKVFTPFWRSDSSRSRDAGGVGLGLALARQIARAHGGELTLAAQTTGPEAGTTARMFVPWTNGGPSKESTSA